MQIRRIALALSSLTIGLIMASLPLSASFVSGNFAPGGTSVRVSQLDILLYHLPGFVPPGCPGTGAPPCSPADSTGNLVVLPPTTGSFVGRAGETATVKNLTRNPGAEPNLAFAPVDSPLAILNWLVLGNAPSITFELTRLTSGKTASGGAAPICGTPDGVGRNWDDAGYQCTPDLLSPFLMTNAQTVPGGPINTDVAMNALGLAWFVATPGDVSTVVISLITTKAQETIHQVLGEVLTVGYTESSLGGSIVVTPIPEPATLVLVGMALVVFGLIPVRRKKTNRS